MSNQVVRVTGVVLKSDFTVDEIGYDDAKSIIVRHHYLGKIYDEHDERVREYKYYGLYDKDILVGAIQYTSYCPIFNGNNALRWYYGCDYSDYTKFYEISRLAVNSKEYNITSWFVSRTMKMIDADYICTSTDSRMHDGIIYVACNMDYHGTMLERVNGYEHIPFNVFSKVYNKDVVREWETKQLDFN